MLHPCQERALGPVPQRMSFLVEQAGKPVPKQVIENGAISHFNLTYADLYRLYTLRTLQTIYCFLNHKLKFKI